MAERGEILGFHPNEPTRSSLLRQIRNFWFSHESAEELYEAAMTLGLSRADLGTVIKGVRARTLTVSKEEKRQALTTAVGEAGKRETAVDQTAADRSKAQSIANVLNPHSVASRSEIDRLVAEEFLRRKPGGYELGPKFDQRKEG